MPEELLLAAPGADPAAKASGKIRTTPVLKTGMVQYPQYETLKSEEAQIIEALQAVGGNKSKAAKLLGVDRSTLYRKMKRYKL